MKGRGGGEETRRRAMTLTRTDTESLKARPCPVPSCAWTDSPVPLLS